jgi:hypothetical protein
VNHDELQARMAADELQDRLEEARSPSEGDMQVSMSVREYALANGLQPQNVYYYIRSGKIHQRPCGECGRKVIDIAEADAIFKKKEPEEES